MNSLDSFKQKTTDLGNTQISKQLVEYIILGKLDRACPPDRTMVGQITDILARMILDSRGRPTIEVDCFVDGRFSARAAVPSGASTGSHEAVELRDGGPMWLGSGVQRSVDNVNTILKNDLINAKEYLKKINNSFSKRLYIEIQRHSLENEKLTETELINLAYSLNIPIVASNEPYFSDENMFMAHDALICISNGEYLDDNERERFTPEHRFKSSEEMSLYWRFRQSFLPNSGTHCQ